MMTSNPFVGPLSRFRLGHFVPHARPTVGAVALSGALLAGLLALTLPTTVTAADARSPDGPSLSAADKDHAGVVGPTYSTGKTGHKLKWLPRRPSKPATRPHPRRDVTGERFAQYTLPAATPTKRQSIDPFDDPFEDGTAATETLSSSAVAHADVSADATPQPLLVDQLPKTKAEGPAVGPEPAKSPTGAEKPGADDTSGVMRDAQQVPCYLAKFKPMSEISCDISIKGKKPGRCPMAAWELPDRQTTGWAPVTFTWKASGLCHKPAYFEDVHLERYGHSWGPYLQPVISGGHFFLTVPILPYKMGLYPPNECIYTLGYYRPGSCAPYMLDPLPLSLRAALFEAGAWTGMAFLIP